MEDPVQLATNTHNFHVVLVRPGSRPLTTQLAERLLVLAARYLVTHLPCSDRGQQSHLEHRWILEAWLARYAETVNLRLAGHIDQTLQELKRGFLLSN